MTTHKRPKPRILGHSPVLVWLVILMPASLPAQTTTPEDLPKLNTETKSKYTTAVSQNQIPAELRPLYNQLLSRDSAVRIKAVQALSLIGGPTSALLLAQAIDDSLEQDAAVRIEAAKGLGDIGGRQALRVLGIALDDSDPTVRKRAVQSLRWAVTVFAVPYIQEALRNDQLVGIRLEAVRMLRKIGTQFSVQPLEEALVTDRASGVRIAATDALGEVGKKERDAARALGGAYRQERDTGVRLEIVASLGLIRDRAGLPFLQEAMDDRNLTVRMKATQVYGRILGLH
jgi:HEAT repeat protein